MILSMLMPPNLPKFTEWTLRENYSDFPPFRVGRRESHFVQEVQPYTSKNSLDRLPPLYAQVKSTEEYKTYIPSTFQCQDHRFHCGCCTDMAHKVLSECEPLLH